VERIVDRLWVEITPWLEDKEPVPEKGESGGSVSGTMSWPGACRALAIDKTWSSRGFRRRRAVREVVETLAPVDGRFFATWLKTHGPHWLDDPRVRAAAEWGDPMKAPAILLGTSHPWSPSSLRYLAHAVWLMKEGYVQRGGRVIEIGVGFGGLAAMLALVADARVTLIDLPEVVAAAQSCMKDLGLDHHLLEARTAGREDLVVSNYAFTELSVALQDSYIEEVLRFSGRGVILSNAEVFSRGIGGRDNRALMAALSAAGIPVREWADAEIIAPSDRLCRNTLLAWKS
jgi:predicted O-methyltransferase YrrM